jgi:hypothetical protein
VTGRRAKRRADQPRLVQQLPSGDELWQLTTPLGDVLHVLPAINDAWPAELKGAVARRRQATLSGRCDCGAQFRMLGQDAAGVMHAGMEHERGCPASDDYCIELLTRWRANGGAV